VSLTPVDALASTELEQCPSDLIEVCYDLAGITRSISVRLSGKVLHMDDERKSSKAGERAAEGLREATAKDEAKNESKTGHDLAKGADRFEERSKSSDGRSAKEKQKG
jgi:hypothetical protein